MKLFIFLILSLFSIESFAATAQVNSVLSPQGAQDPTGSIGAASPTVPFSAIDSSGITVLMGGTPSAGATDFFGLYVDSTTQYKVPIVLTTTANLTSGSVCTASQGSVANLYVGAAVIDTTTAGNIPRGTQIAAIPGTCGAGNVQLTNPAGGSGTGDSLTFGKRFYITDIWVNGSSGYGNYQLGAGTAALASEGTGTAPAGVVYLWASGKFPTSTPIRNGAINVIRHYGFASSANYFDPGYFPFYVYGSSGDITQVTVMGIVK